MPGLEDYGGGGGQAGQPGRERGIEWQWGSAYSPGKSLSGTKKASKNLVSGVPSGTGTAR